MSQFPSHTHTHQVFGGWYQLATVTALMSSGMPDELIRDSVEATRELVAELQSHETDVLYSWDGQEPENIQRECERGMVEIALGYVEAAEADLAERATRNFEAPSEADIDAFLASILGAEDDFDREPAEPEDDDYL